MKRVLSEVISECHKSCKNYATLDFRVWCKAQLGVKEPFKTCPLPLTKSSVPEKIARVRELAAKGMRPKEIAYEMQLSDTYTRWLAYTGGVRFGGKFGGGTLVAEYSEQYGIKAAAEKFNISRHCVRTHRYNCGVKNEKANAS